MKPICEKRATVTASTCPSSLSVSTSQVKQLLEIVNWNKASCPESRWCHPEGLHIIAIFQSTKTIIHLPSTTANQLPWHPTTVDLESPLSVHLNEQRNTFQDWIQFAYNPGIGVEDVICLLQRAHSHLDQAGSTARIKFFGFSNAFIINQQWIVERRMLHK